MAINMPERLSGTGIYLYYLIVCLEKKPRILEYGVEVLPGEIFWKDCGTVNWASSIRG
jgi:hypothetical protein